MKSNLELPRLISVGAGRRFLIYVEIARHPEGLTVSDITAKFEGKRSVNKAFANDKISIWRHVKLLRERGFVTTEYEKRNGHVSQVCRITEPGIKELKDEMCRLCHMLQKVQEELVNNV